MQIIEPERLTVAAGLVFDSQGRILIGQRTAPERYKGQWEFPGGKVHAGESMANALTRELCEEVGIHVRNSSAYVDYPYDYPDLQVHLYFRTVNDYVGVPGSREGQNLRWIDVFELNMYNTLEGSRAVIDMLQQDCRTISYRRT